MGKQHRIWGMLLILCVLLAGASLPAAAHSSLEKAVPGDSAVLKTTPSLVELWFHDPIDIYSGSIQVFDQGRNEVQQGKPFLDPKDPRHVTVSLEKEIGPGTYTVEFHILAQDGHLLNESYQFEVEGNSSEEWRGVQLAKSTPADGTILHASPTALELWFTQPPTEIVAVGVFDDQRQNVPLGQAVQDPTDPSHFRFAFPEPLHTGTYSVSWNVYAEPKYKNGMIYFAVDQVTAIAPVGGKSAEGILGDLSLGDAAQWLVFMGLLPLFGGNMLLMTATGSSGNPERWKRVTWFLYAFAVVGLILLFVESWRELPDASMSEILALRTGLIPLAALAVFGVGYPAARGVIRLLVVGMAILFFTLTGHAASPEYGGVIANVLAGVHMLAVSVWMGGLLALVAATPREGIVPWLKKTGRTFSKWAVLSTALIIVTGIGMTIEYVPSFTWESLAGSNWGMMLLVKVALFLAVIGLGYSQRRFLKRFVDEGIPSFLKKSKFELAAGAVILLASSVLIDLSPMGAQEGISPKQVNAQGLTAELEITPLQAGYNEINLSFDKALDFKQVAVSFHMPPDFNAKYNAFPLGNGKYRIVGNQLHAPGTMYVNVEAERVDGEKLMFSFQVQIPSI